MNKQEKIISLVLGLALAWCLFHGASQKKSQPERRPAEAKAAESAAAKGAPANGAALETAAAAAKAAEPARTEAVKALPATPEEIVILENDELKLELSTWGGVVKKATLKQYAKKLGPVGEGNPAVEFDFARNPLGMLGGVDGSDGYEIKAANVTSNSVEFKVGGWRRKVTLGENYLVTYEDSCERAYTAAEMSPGSISLGSMSMGLSANDLLSVDSWALDAGKGKEGVVHHGDDDSPLKPFLAGGVAGGCGACSRPASAAAMPASQSVAYRSPQRWVALKDRFFVVALASTTAASEGFVADIDRNLKAQTYRPENVAVRALVEPSSALKMTSVFYIGPKKQSLLWDLGMKDVMEFGMWRWICYPVVWLLVKCHSIIPSYGIAIILLTILVRLVFWPLTRKSTEGMKKMQEIQPLMKELQAKFKDNPQRLQQETWALYREKKVNPLSSCLPMFIQIPVFIALFNVLRSAVELRYAGFLWIADLSEPEHLFALWFPFGGLNILPLLMAATMFLQSKLTPSTGDASQQRMMTVFMPLMMLVMFYNFASALSLYWTLSQVMSIVQMWLIRRETERKRKVFEPEVIDPPATTRQMRRHS